MGQLNSYRKRIGHIDILSDDALLYVFSYLSTLDKIKNERVCKKWNRLLRYPDVWKTVDTTPLICSHYLKPMSYTEKQAAVLQFLRKYAGPSTKQVHLQDYGSNQILEFLRLRCTQLDELFVNAELEDIDLGLLPSNLQSLVLSFHSTYELNNSGRLRLPSNDESGLAEKLFSRLLHFDVSDILITEAFCSVLLHSKRLCHLTLSKCFILDDSRFVTLLSELKWINKLSLSYCRFPTEQQFEEFMTSIRVECSKLESLGLWILANNRGWQHVYSDLDSFLKSSRLDMLINLNLAGCYTMTNEAFAVFSQHHQNLETLELSCKNVNDDFLFTIATNFVKLRSLQLRKARVIPTAIITDVGLNYLAHHPSLQNLTVAFSTITGKAVSSTVCTLPKIRHLSLFKIQGYKKCVVTLKKCLPELTISFI